MRFQDMLLDHWPVSTARGGTIIGGRGIGGWQHLARWIDANLPLSWAQFSAKYWAFNINWHERPVKRIGSYVAPRGRWR